MSAFIQGKGDVFGPIGAVSGNIPVFDGTSGKIIKDGGIFLGALLNGPANSTDGEIPVFSGVTGKVIRRYTGITGFPKIQQDAAPSVVATIEGADLGPGAIHNQTQKTTDLVDVDEFMVWDSTVSALRRIASSKVRYLPGQVVQIVYAELAAEIMTDLEIQPPLNITKGVEILSATITPRYANSKILVTAQGIFAQYASPATICSAVFMAFVAGTSLSFATATRSTYGDGMAFGWEITATHTPGATTAKSYSIRMANVNSPTSILNLHANGYQLVTGGFSPLSTLLLQEIKQ